MKMYNFSKIIKKDNKPEVKTKAEFLYLKKEKNGKVVEKKFVSTFISTIDTPYGKYALK